MTESDVNCVREQRPRHTRRMRKRAFKKTLLAITATSIVAVGGSSLTGLAAQAATGSDAAVNFVANDTFNSGLDGWMGGSETKISSGEGRDATQGVRLTNTSSAARSVMLNDRSNAVSNTVAGHTYEATAWVRSEKAGQSVLLRLLEEDAGYNVIDSQQTHQWRTGTAWKKITTNYTATRAASSIDLHVLGLNMKPENAVVIDNVSLIDTTENASADRPTAPPTPTSTPTPTATTTPPAGWNLAWSDEFNGSGIDRTKWKVDNLSTYGDGNNEVACLMDRPENVKTADGLLTITARKESAPVACGTNDSRFPNGRSYTSAMLSTKDKIDFEYGRFEISAKTPLTQGPSKGLWPAFWMRPASGGIGELDILEAVGTSKADSLTANKLVHTIHYDYVGTHPQQATTYTLPTGTTADGFHNYAVEWAPGSIKWYVDGVLSAERNISTTSWLDEAFVKDFYLRLNMAVGGNWPGAPDADTAFPATYQVDYVRVYQR